MSSQRFEVRRATTTGKCGEKIIVCCTGDNSDPQSSTWAVRCLPEQKWLWCVFHKVPGECQVPLEDGVTQTGPGLRRHASSTSFLLRPHPLGFSESCASWASVTGKDHRRHRKPKGKSYTFAAAAFAQRRWLPAPGSSLPFFQAVPLPAEVLPSTVLCSRSQGKTHHNQHVALRGCVP